MPGYGVMISNPQSGPKGVDYRGSVWGSPIPLSAGFRRLNGAVLWAGPQRRTEEVPSYIPHADGSAVSTAIAWNVRQSFAVALGYRLNPNDSAPLVRRIWIDGVLVWDNGTGSPVVFSSVDERYIPAGARNASGVWVVQSGAVGDGTMVFPNYNESKLVFRFHDGNEDQIPDPEILADKGSLAPSYRGLMYMVISDLIVAQGTLARVTPAPVFPAVSVELADGSITTSELHNFRMIAGSYPIPFFGQVKMSDFDRRLICTVNPRLSSAPSTVNFYDMDTATQLSQYVIADGGDTIGATDNFCTWDRLNGIIYTARSNRMACSLSETGVVISNSLEGAIGPASADGGPPDEDEPMVKCSSLHHGAVDYVVSANDIQPVLFAAIQGGFAMAMKVGKDGTMPTSVPFESFYQSPGQFPAICPFKIWERAVDEHLSYQDVAFLITTRWVFLGGGAPTVEIVYVNITAGVAKILGRQRIYDGVHPTLSLVSAFVDAEGHICIRDDNGDTGITTYTRLSVDYGSPDFSEAPGWRGIFPRVGGPLYDHKPANMVSDAWEKNTLVNSELSAGTAVMAGNGMFNIKDGTVTAIGAGLTNSGEHIWDSQAGVLFFHGTYGADELPLQTFAGQGMRFKQVWSGINGTIGSLSATLGYLATAAGFSLSNVTIDTKLTDQVPGVVITKPYSVSQLFNDIAAVYDFTYFNSGGTLKFERNSNNPLVATGQLTFTGLPTDAQTVTIGTFVYRFKNTPSAPFDVKIGVDTNVATLDAVEKTEKNLFAAIKGDIGLADSVDGFFAGTTAHTKVSVEQNIDSATLYGFRKIDIRSNLSGTAGNSIVTTETATNVSFGAATLTGGEEPPVPVADITLADLAHVSENQLTPDDALVTMILPEGMGQLAAQINYYALEQTYSPLSQVYTPDNRGDELVSSVNTVVYDLPFVMSTSEAYARASKTAIRAGDNVVMQNFRLPQSFLLLEPTDIVTVTIAPYAYTVKLDECTFNGDFSTSYTAANYLFRTDIPVSGSDVGSSLPQDVATSSDAIPVVLDTPVLDPAQGTIAGAISLMDGVRAYRTGFQSALLSYKELDEYINVFTTSQDVKWGTFASMPTAVAPYYRTVEDSIDIVSKTIAVSDVASASYYDFVAGVNCLAIGRPGHWEYVYFRDVTWLSDKVVRVTGLIRAQRGTDAFVTHNPSDVVLLVASGAASFNSALRPQAADVAKVGDVFTYRAIGVPSTRDPVEQANTIKGYELYPFSPCSLAAAPGASSSVDLSWVRRDRLNTEYVTNPTILSETSEAYELEILSGSTVVRTVTGLTSPTWNYSSANQTTDGFTPPVTSIKFRVYQMGELGRGFPGEETVDVN